MTHADCRRGQAAVLDQVLRILGSDPRVLGVAIAGSCSRGENDAFSDVDVGCWLREESLPGRQELYDRIGAIGPLLCRLWIYDKHSLYLYESGVRLDLDFLKPSDLAAPTHVYGDTRIVYDPDGALARALSREPAPCPAPHPKWFEPGDPDMLDHFFWMARQIVCWAMRGAQGGPKAYSKLSSAVSSLAEVRTRIAEMRLWTLGVQDYLERVDPVCAEHLAQTYPHLEGGDIVRCARLLLDEYERIGAEYCAKSGAAFPSRKVGVTRALVASFEGMQ
jgi:hypothetical protein